jgi:hypothetical protein
MQINFYSGIEKLVKVGWYDDDVKYWGKTVESFEISEDERLIGCEIYYDKSYFLGVTWFKMKDFK